MEKKLFSGLDVGKLIAAIMVVLLHTVETRARVPAGVKYVATSFAVPFFFITSGFFFYRGLMKSSEKKKYFIAYEINVLKILIVWELIYLPFEIYSYLQNNPGASCFRIFGLLFRRMVIIGAGPYWYLVALFWSAAFLYICLTRKKEILLWSGILLGISLEIAYSCFQGCLSELRVFRMLFKLIYVIWSCESNFLTFGIPFMGIGYLVAQREGSLPVRTSIALFCLGTILRLLEYELPHIFPGKFWEGNNISLAFALQAVLFFLWMKEWKPNITETASMTIRQLSSCIYFTHLIFLYEILNPLMNRYTSLPTYNGAMVFPKVIVTLAMCLLFFAIIKKLNNKRLNILING